MGVLAREPDAFRAIAVLMPAGLVWRFIDDTRPLRVVVCVAVPFVPFPFREALDAIFRGIAFAADEAVASVKFRSKKQQWRLRSAMRESKLPVRVIYSFNQARLDRGKKKAQESNSIVCVYIPP